MKKQVLGYMFNIMAVIIVVCFYGFLSSCLQAVIDMTPTSSMIVTDVVMTILCGWAYFYLCSTGKFKCKPVKMHTKDIVLQILAFVFIAFTLLLVFYWISIYFPDPTMDSRYKSIEKDSVGTYILMSCIFAPVAEEFMMRLFLYNLCKTRSDWVVSMIGISMVFALIHGTVSHVIMGVIFGVFLTLSYENTERWYFPIIGHFIYNFMAIFCAGFISILAKITPLVIMFVLVLLVLMIQQMMPVLAKYDDKLKYKRG